jgi:hypothetical protein
MVCSHPRGLFHGRSEYSSDCFVLAHPETNKMTVARKSKEQRAAARDAVENLTLLVISHMTHNDRVTFQNVFL